MAKTSRTPKQRLDVAKIDARQALAGLPNADKLLAFAADMASPTADETQTQSRPIPVGQRTFSAMHAAEAARQIGAVIGMKVDSVSAVNRSETGWDVIVDVIELARIPPSTDLIAAYHVTLDTEGNLQSYSRGTRYTRGQTGEGL